RMEPPPQRSQCSLVLVAASKVYAFWSLPLMLALLAFGMIQTLLKTCKHYPVSGQEIPLVAFKYVCDIIAKIKELLG
ncbi:MAG: hypothetical protein AAB014_03950, partial [Nitrospirota bacterium]